MSSSNFPTFHDGYLKAVSVDRGRASLTIQRVDGSHHELLLAGVEAFQIDDFREGNIISFLEVFTGREPIGDDYEIWLERLYPSPHPSADTNYHDQHKQLIARIKARVASGEAVLVVVEPSYGADVAAICASVSLRVLPPMAG